MNALVYTHKSGNVAPQASALSFHLVGPWDRARGWVLGTELGVSARVTSH